MAFKIRRTKAGVVICATATDKLGFFGTAPVAQQAAITKGTANSTTTDAIIDALTAYGLLAKLVIIGLMLFAFTSMPVQAGVTTDTPGVTNGIAASTTLTSAAALGTKVWNVDNNEHCTVWIYFKGADADTGDVTATFARSSTGVTWETTPQIAVTVAANGTNTVAFPTNITSSVVGAAKYLKLVKFANAATNALSGVAIEVQRKKIY